MAKDRGKTNAARRLDELGIAYELVRFEPDPDDLSAERAAADTGVPPERMYKTLVARGDRTGVLEVCLPAGRELDLKALASASGNKSVSLVTVRELTSLTGYVRGGCSPIAGKREYPVFICAEAAKHDKIAISAGARGVLLLISPDDLAAAVGATLADIAK